LTEISASHFRERSASSLPELLSTSEVETSNWEAISMNASDVANNT